MKERILKLREEGKTYNEIKNILGCSKGTISYHCGEGQVEKTNIRNNKIRALNPLKKKIENFNNRIVRIKTVDFQRNRGENGLFTQGRDNNFDIEQLLKKLIKNPKCYLTGDTLDLSKPSTYSFDHIIPVTKGGSNKLSNLGLTKRSANIAKHNLLLEDFIQLCKEVLEHNGLEVNRK